MSDAHAEHTIAAATTLSDPLATKENAEEADSSVAIEVRWNTPEDQDPANPFNWSSRVKWANILTISTISFLV